MPTSPHSWKHYKESEHRIATGTSTMSKRPRFEPEEPCYIAHGAGCRVWDIDGREFIDFRNALGPITLGYCFPAVDAAIRAQLNQGIIFGHPTLLEAEVAELLIAAIPCAEKVRYLKTGGEAMAAAFKVARAATGRDIILQCGYNGWLNSLASGGAVLPGVRQDAPLGVPSDIAKLHRMLPWGDLAPWEQTFQELDGRIAGAAVAMDYFAPEKAKDFVRGLRGLTQRHGAVLMIDEIVTGFRIARGGLHEYCGVNADLAVFSKGIANGMPLSVLAGKAHLLDVIEKAPISSTFSGETLSLAAARAAITTYRNNDVIGHLARTGKRFQGGLNDLFKQRNYPLECVGLPSCMALTPRETPTSTGAKNPLDDFFRAAYRHGVSLYNVCYPNFSHTDHDIDEALDRLAKAMDDLA